MDDKELSALVECYNTLRLRRLEMQAAVDEVKRKEDAMSEQIITTMREAKLTSIGAQTANVFLKLQDEPTVNDWQALHAHILASGEFDLLHKRVMSTAARERWAAGVEIPGVEKYPRASLRITQVRPLDSEDDE